MYYLAALKAGVDVKTVAHDFAEELVRASKDVGELCLETTFNFINDTLLAMGITGKITPEQIEQCDFTYEWPNELLQVYSFHYNQFEFGCVEKFMVALCGEMDKQNIALVHASLSDENFDWEEHQTDCPLELLMELLAVWHCVYKQLLNVDTWGITNMFVEPLSRINYHLFLAMNELRRKYRDSFPILDKICKNFYHSAIQGLRYPQTHNMVLEGSFNVVDRDLELFQEEAILFLYEAFIVEHDPATNIKLYKFLQAMLEECDGNRLKILTDILIKETMLDIYNTTLLTWSGKDLAKQQREALAFLNILQSKLVVLDCFSRDFHESILCLVLQTNSSIANLASNVYVTMMKRKVSEELILNHILEFYIAYAGSSSELKDYVTHFYNNFPYIHNVHNVLDLVSSSHSTEVIRLMSSQMVVIIVEIISKTNDKPTQEIEPFIQILPEILQNISDGRIVGILLGVLKFVSFEALQRQTIDHFIYYTVGILMQTKNNLEYPLLMNIFDSFHKSLNVTKEWHHLELISDRLMTEYREIIKKLAMMENEKNEQLSNDFYQHFCGVLKRINIIIKADYEIFDFLPSLLNTLQRFVIAEDSLVSRNKSSSLIAMYALEVYISGIVKLAKREPEDTISSSFCFIKAVDLLKYLENPLENIEEFLKLSAFQMKVYFCGILHLHSRLPLTLTNDTYYRMIQILIALLRLPKPGKGHEAVYDELQQIHPLQSLEYYRVMFQHFAEMHKFQHIQIKSNVVWKLCLHYGKPHNKFNEELKNLLITLATYRLKTYKHINAVLIHNLYKQQPPLTSSTIILLLKRHRHLIDNEIPIESPQILKVHIVLMVLQIVEKALSVQRISSRINRVEALKHLHIFLTDLDLSSMKAKDLLLGQLSLIDKHLMSREEIKVFVDCQQEMDNF